MRSRTILSMSLALVMLLGACGQKPGIHVAISNGGSGNGGGDVSGDGGTGSGSGDSSGTGDTSGTGGSDGSSGGGGVSGGGSSGGGSGGSSGGGGGALPGATRIGITKDMIIIGIHAPTSGAAPIEPKAFKYGVNVYWNYIESKHIRINGRRVKVYFEDDKYKPSDAVDACTKLTSGGNAAFLLIGAAGTDQIRACANYANPRGIPYLSAGVQEAAVKSYDTYSAVTMSYAAQMPLLVQYWKAVGAAALDKYGPNAGAKDGIVKIAMVRPNTPNFNDSQVALEKAFLTLPNSTKGTCTPTYKWCLSIKTVLKEGTQDEAAQRAQELKTDGIDVVSPITAPNFTVFLAGSAGTQQYNPRYMGVGVTNGINQAIAQECHNQDFKNAMFFSPAPGWDQRNNAQVGDPDFEAAVNMDANAKSINSRNAGGDLLMLIWGFMKSLHKMLLAAGPNLTRQSFIHMLQTYQGSDHFFPDLAFTPGNHFGARGVHALLGQCDANGNSGQFIEDPTFGLGLHKSFP